MDTSLLSALRPEEFDLFDGGSSRTSSYTVECADPHRHNRAVRLLIERMYEWRGLAASDTELQTHRPDRITLVASDESAIFGTITLGLDGENGILADTLYPEELQRLRQRGARLCELTRLAMDTQHNAKEVLGALFHLVYIHGRLLHGATDLVIEVHPRHASFYRRMMGFKFIGEERVCPRVNAPAVLLHLELSYVDAQIAQHGGSGKASARTLYSYFLSPEEQSAILRGLAATH